MAPDIWRFAVVQGPRVVGALQRAEFSLVPGCGAAEGRADHRRRPVDKCYMCSGVCHTRIL